ncbi:hypothetical protein RhiTH_001941 [Rhizoctonia solani]
MPIDDQLSKSDALTANQVKSYVLRTDAVAHCSVADVHAVPEAIKVDDGTASINCLKRRPERMSMEELGESSSFHRLRGFEIGDIVSVIGKIESYKEVRQLYVSSIGGPLFPLVFFLSASSNHQLEKCTSPNAESQHLLHVLRQHRDVYSQPFKIPPLPDPSTPKESDRFTPQYGYAPSMASSPATADHSSPVGSPKEDKPRLRHPSRLRSKDLNENVFRMYLSHIVVSTLSMPESTSHDILPLESMSGNTSNSTPRPSQKRAGSDSFNKTPTRSTRPYVDSFGSPTPRKPAGLISDEGPTPTLGVTLSYLRRVRVLSDLARRVVDNAAHERDKAMRHAERSARAKYEAAHSSISEKVAPSSATASASKTTTTLGSHSKSSRVPHKSSSAKAIAGSSRTSTESLPLQRSSATQSRMGSNPNSIRSSSTPRSSSRVSQPITPEETARRAAYHAKLSKLHDEDKKKQATRMKRLFESALRTLVSEGELILFDGPKRQIPLFNEPTGRISQTPSGIWHDVTSATASSSASTISTALTAPSCSDLETISEGDGQSTELLSDPSDSEDAYIPVTLEVLRPVMLAALRRCLIAQRGGVDLKTWAEALRSDGQWSCIPDLVVKEMIESLRREEWVTRVGPEQWDFTRGSWARSLKLS